MRVDHWLQGQSQGHLNPAAQQVPVFRAPARSKIIFGASSHCRHHTGSIQLWSPPCDLCVVEAG